VADLRSQSLKFRTHQKLIQQELSYRKQIVRRLRTQYTEGIYRHKYYTVTGSLKITGSGNGTNWTDHTRLSRPSSQVIRQ